MEWNEIRQLLQGLSASLKHLTLKIPARHNVLNGQQWEEFLIDFSGLRTFNVFFISSYNGSWTEILNGYRSPFWSKQKKWYFTGIGSILCSLSCYGSDLCLSDMRVPEHTAPTNDWFYSNSVVKFDAFYLTESSVNNCQVPEHQFHAQKIVLEGNFEPFDTSAMIQYIAARVDLSCIRRFESYNPTLTKKFLLALRTEMPCLTELNIVLPSDFMTFKRFPRFEHIRRVRCSPRLATKFTEDFIRIFPNVEHLSIHIQSNNQIFRLVEELTRLQSIHLRRHFDLKRVTHDELRKRTSSQNHLFTLHDFNVRTREYKTNPITWYLSGWLSRPSAGSQLTEHSSISRYNRIKRYLTCVLFIFPL